MSMKHFHLRSALTLAGWQENVFVSVDQQGTITHCQSAPLTDTDYQVVNEPVIPGFINLHSHAFQYAFAGFTELRKKAADSFWTWRETMYRMLETLTPDDYYVVAKQAYSAMLKAGYTQVGEFHYVHHGKGGKHYDDIAEMSKQCIRAARDVGIRICHMPVLYQRGDFDGKSLTEKQSRFHNTLDDYAQLMASLNGETKDSTVTLGMAPHSLRAVASKVINEMLNIDAVIPNHPLHIHISEQEAEVDACLAYHGCRPIELLADKVGLSDRWCLVHATHADTKELESIIAGKAVVGLCPLTEANLGDGIFPAKTFFEQQGRFGIGSDSHILLNPWEELRWLEYGQRLVHKQRAVLANQAYPDVARNIFVAAAMGGAQALQSQTGQIAEGYQADWLCLKADFSAQKDLSFWMFATAANPVAKVMVAGRWVVDAKDTDDEGDGVNSSLQTKKFEALLSRL